MANKDQVLETLRKDIENYRIQSFQNFGLDVFVNRTSTAKPLHDFEGNWLGYREYTFDVFDKPEKTMKVLSNSEGKVKIRYMERWTPVSSYLNQLQPPIDWNDPGRFSENENKTYRWQQQWRWWQINKKTFRLLDLPSEIREMIYGFSFGPIVEPYPTSKARRLGQNTGFIRTRKPNASLLMTCRKVYVEASSILFVYTPFFVQHFGVLGTLMARREQRSRIRQLKLALTHDEFFRFFGGRLDGNGGKNLPSRAAGGLRHMKLDRLELRVAAPSITTETRWLDAACQKTVVDWILDAAWPLVRGHPVEVTASSRLVRRRLSRQRA